MSGTPWTTERDQYITENRGRLSASQMGAHLGVTRNAVIGRSHRLCLPKSVRPKAAPRPPRVKRDGTIIRAPKFKFVSAPIPVEPLNVEFRDLQPFHCREIITSDGLGNTLSCGHQVVHETSWCHWHFSVNTEARRAVRPYGFIRRAA